MTTMAPYYAHESDVGPVFDVANYSRFEAIKMAIISLGFGCFVAFVAAYVWNPDWIISEPSAAWTDAHQEVKDLMLEHRWGVKIGVGIAIAFALLCFAGAISCAVNAAAGDFYIRVGEGGISLRVPDGLVGAFNRDISWSHIDKLTVVQVKQLGAMSRNAGNLGGELQLRTHDGVSRDFRLDDFRQDAWLIHKRIEEAMEMRPAEFAEV